MLMALVNFSMRRLALRVDAGEGEQRALLG
jgi:hypothetical protein